MPSAAPRKQADVFGYEGLAHHFRLTRRGGEMTRRMPAMHCAAK